VIPFTFRTVRMTFCRWLRFSTSTSIEPLTPPSPARSSTLLMFVPVDVTASEDAFRELYGIYHLAAGGPAALTQNVTVTRSDMIKFGE